MEEVGGYNGEMAISARVAPGRPMAATSIEECGGYSESLQRFSVKLADRSITTTLTWLASEVERWITDTIRIHRRRLDHLVVGLDVEWRPSFNPRVEHPAALLQLCVGHRCLVFQLLHADSIPKALFDFLGNPTFCFVGVGIESDLEKLLEGYELGANRWADLRSLAADKLGSKELKSAGIKKLAEVALGLVVNKPKRVTMSRWDQPWLAHDQVQYATIDAYLSFEIGRFLISPPPPSST